MHDRRPRTGGGVVVILWASEGSSAASDAAKAATRGGCTWAAFSAAKRRSAKPRVVLGQQIPGEATREGYRRFPTPIVEVLQGYIVEAELVSVRDIDPRLAELDDWELLLALHHHRGKWLGLMITTDSGILFLPKELAVVLQTKLTLVVAEAAGHDPLLATGLVLSSLPRVCKKATEQPGGVFRLRQPYVERADGWDVLGRIADHRNTTAKELFRSSKLSRQELARNPLA